MKYNRRIKNKNIKYCLVGERVFNSLRVAELFCNDNGFDVNDCILSENKDVLAEAKKICSYVLPLLYDMEKELQGLYDEKEKIYYRKVAEFKKAETKRDLLYGYKREQLQRAMGVLEGISMIKNVIRKQIAVHSSVTHLKGGE